jgi:Domain of unknown function (DUF397)
VDPSRLEWRKSTRSQLNGCVEVAFADERVAVRDSKDRQGPMLVFSFSEWEEFIRRIRSEVVNVLDSP